MDFYEASQQILAAFRAGEITQRQYQDAMDGLNYEREQAQSHADEEQGVAS